MTLEAEHHWIATHSKEVERFAGKFIAVLRGQIVASGDSYERVWADVKARYPSELPLITYVLKPGEEELIA